MKPTEICEDEQRRIDARRKPLNGIDHIEVERGSGPLAPPTLAVYFFGKVPDELASTHIAIEGGTRITGIKASDVQLCPSADGEQEGFARVAVNKGGDLSTYTLRITGLAGFDPVYSSFDFTFKPDCPADLDCGDERPCPPERGDEPEIDYLAKDYQGFRQLILDRWALIVPEWKERHIPDLGIALAEILAYTGDHLSYYQDAVATEAYIGTSRLRVSVRRHARLVDYSIHEGCNARALICIETDAASASLDPTEVYFVTNTPIAGEDGPAVLQQEAFDSVSDSAYEVFEPLTTEPILLHQARNRITFYTWGNRQCCLPKGATSATFKDDWEASPASPDSPPPYPRSPSDRSSPPANAPYGASKAVPAHAPIGKPSSPPTLNRELAWGYKAEASAPRPYYEPPPPRKLDSLKAGDILILMEVLGPDTGVEADADPLHRQAVRITRVERVTDDLYRQPVVNVWWDPADALTFALCISSLGRAPQFKSIENVSIACGNVILADHGRRVENEPLDGFVPLKESIGGCAGPGRPAENAQVPGFFRPVLKRGPLTFVQPYRGNTPASGMFQQDPSQAIPCITLNMVTLTGVWDASMKMNGGEHTAVLLFQQLGDALDGSFSGALGNFNVYGTVQGNQVAWKRVNPPDNDSTVTFSATLHDGTLEGTFTAKAGGTFTALKRTKDTLWKPQRDLLASGPRDNHFVVEVDNDGFAHFRFGDGRLGRAPEAGATFVASYRTGNGTAANLGANTMHLVLRKTVDGLGVTKVSSPLPSAGGTNSEALNDVKLLAPSAFRRRLERAITADDYATLAGQNTKVQRAAGSLRFTGSRYAVQVAIDPFGTERPDPALLDEIKGYLYRFRRIDHDLEVVSAHYVKLDIEMTICVRPDYLRAHVEVAVYDALGAGILPDGRLGFFHPDNLSFGDSIYLSRLVATAQAVTGVQSVEVKKLERLYLGANQELQAGVLQIGPLEIARLDRDPNFPENGILKLNMGGGR